MCVGIEIGKDVPGKHRAGLCYKHTECAATVPYLAYDVWSTGSCGCDSSTGSGSGSNIGCGSGSSSSIGSANHQNSGNEDDNYKNEGPQWNASYTFAPTDQTIYVAVALWVTQPTHALWKYGHISGWSTDSVTNMSRLFYYPCTKVSKCDTAFNEDLSNWNTSGVLDMNNMFYGRSFFNSDLSAWDVSSVRDTAVMFGNNHNFESDLSVWDIGRVETAAFMFYRAHSFFSNLSQWNTSSCTNFKSMFAKAHMFATDVSKWNVRKVTDISRMFYDAGDDNPKAWDAVHSPHPIDLSGWIFNNIGTAYVNMDRFRADAGRFLTYLYDRNGVEHNCAFETPGSYGSHQVAHARFFCRPELLRAGAACDADSKCESGACRGYCCEQHLELQHQSALCGNNGLDYYPLSVADDWSPSQFLNEEHGWSDQLVTNHFTSPFNIPGELDHFAATDTQAVAFALQYLSIDGGLGARDTARGIFFQLRWAAASNDLTTTTTKPTTTTTTTTTLATTTRCADNEDFSDPNGDGCDGWIGYVCDTYAGMTEADMVRVRENCRVSCNLCPSDSRLAQPSAKVTIALQNSCSNAARNGDCRPGDNPLGVAWDRAAAPGSVGIDSETGLVYAAPDVAGNYTAWLVAINTNGAASSVGLPSEIDQVLLKQWDFEVKDPKAFRVELFERTRTDDARPGVFGTSYAEVSGAQAAKIYAVGETYRFAPIKILAAYNFADEDGTDDPNNAGITFTIISPPPGFLIDPETGFISGVPTQPGNFSMQVYAVNSIGSRTLHPIEMITFDVRQGPGGRPCANDAEMVPDIPFVNFTCDCTKTLEHEGDNCADSIAERLAMEHATAALHAATVAEEKASTTTGAAVGAILLILLIIGALKYRHWVLSMQPVDFDTQFALMVSMGLIEQTQVKRHMKPREIRRKDLTLVKVIGSGAFGEVYKAQLDELFTRRTPEYTVAAKTVLDAQNSPEATKEMLAEAGVMAAVGSHPNLVSLIGIITRGDPLVLVLQFCAQGELLGMLKKAAAKGDPIAVMDKMQMAREVAQGMTHLSKEHFIHRDLACRNVLYADGMCKIADFGLSRGGGFDGEEVGAGMHEDYYKSTAGVFPIRWTAPEAMETFRFTTTSDVWSFGIVVIELLVDGETPYHGMSNPDVMKLTMSGGRHPKPPLCSNKLYKTLLKCWDAVPANRPTFPFLCDAFKEMYMVSSTSADANAARVEAAAKDKLERGEAINQYTNFGTSPDRATLAESDAVGKLVNVLLAGASSSESSHATTGSGALLVTTVVDAMDDGTIAADGLPDSSGGKHHDPRDSFTTQAAMANSQSYHLVAATGAGEGMRSSHSVRFREPRLSTLSAVSMFTSEEPAFAQERTCTTTQSDRRTSTV
jgi:serine/threonine protein kinase